MLLIQVVFHCVIMNKLTNVGCPKQMLNFSDQSHYNFEITHHLVTDINAPRLLLMDTVE